MPVSFKRQEEKRDWEINHRFHLPGREGMGTHLFRFKGISLLLFYIPL